MQEPLHVKSVKTCIAVIKGFPGGKEETPPPTFRGSKKFHSTQFKKQFYIIYIISELFTVKIGHKIYPLDYITFDTLSKTLYWETHVIFIHLALYGIFSNNSWLDF